MECIRGGCWRMGGERLVMTHAVNDPKGQLVGVMFIARNLEYLGQVQSTIRYSRKLAALGRLSAGVAHEVKNPLNAMMIHLELLRQQVSQPAAAGASGAPDGPRHRSSIAAGPAADAGAARRGTSRRSGHSRAAVARPFASGGERLRRE